MNRGRTSPAALLLALLLVGPGVRAEAPLTGAQALERLKAGNTRFAADKPNRRSIQSYLNGNFGAANSPPRVAAKVFARCTKSGRSG